MTVPVSELPGPVRPPTLAGAMRSKLLAPDPGDVTFERRGFHAPGAEQQANLEKVGRMFLAGYGIGMTGRGLAEIAASLEDIERPFRGFAYEGCSMALAVRDALLPLRRHWIRDFLAGPAAPHIYMAHIGIGWAMARLPSVRWRAIMPADEVLGWLALDGYGFHQAYFKTRQYVDGQYQGRIPLWRPSAYAARAVDQGIGRALWFVHGSDVQHVARAIGRFAQSRHGDLWSGAALASVYAGGAEADDLRLMADLAGRHLPDAAQGAAFAATARLQAGLVTTQTEVSVRVYCGMSVEDAASLCAQATEVLAEPAGTVPAYELWRRRIRGQFTS